VAGEMAKLASGMDFGVVLKIAWELHHGLAFWSGIPIQRKELKFSGRGIIPFI
jgi:hypothetical protein